MTIEFEGGITHNYTVGVDTLFLTIEGPVEGTSYSVMVVAVNGAGQGQPGMFHEVTRKDSLL